MSISRQQLGALIAAVSAVLPFSAPADAVLRGFFRSRPEMGSRDRAFVAEAVYALLRRKGSLDRLVPSASPRALVLAALVKLQGLSVRDLEPLLRRDEFAWLRALKACSVDGPGLAEIAELPEWVIDKLRGEWPDSEILDLGRALQTPAPLDLRVNTWLTSRQEVLAALAADGIDAQATPYSPCGVRLSRKLDIHRHPLFRSGHIEVQDEGSQLLSYVVAPRRREMVVDFCAGAGGKSLLLGALMQSSGRVYAFDVSRPRLNNLRERLKRSGLSNLHPILVAGESDDKISRLAGKADKVLVDAPCSGLGTLRRNPDLKWRQTPQALGELTAKQEAILRAAAALVRPGGRLVYATCSFLPDENDAIIAQFLAARPQFAVVPCGGLLTAQGIPLEMSTYLRLYPHQHRTDAFFAAVLESSDPHCG